MRTRPIRLLALWLPAAVCLMTAPAAAQTVAADPAASHPELAADGQKAAVDPATGRLRAITPEEARALIDAVSRSLSQSSDGLAIVAHPNGMLSIDLDGRFESASLARVEPDGSVATRCVSTVDEAQAFLSGATATPSAPPAKSAAKKDAQKLEEK